MPRSLGRSNSRAVLSARGCGLHPSHDKLRGVSVSRVTCEKSIAPGSLLSSHGHVTSPHLPVYCLSPITLASHLKKELDPRRRHESISPFITTLDWVWSQSHVPFPRWTYEIKPMALGNSPSDVPASTNVDRKKRAAIKMASKFRAGFVCKIFRLVEKIFPWLQFLSEWGSATKHVDSCPPPHPACCNNWK